MPTAKEEAHNSEASPAEAAKVDDSWMAAKPETAHSATSGTEALMRMALPALTVTQENFKEVMYSTCAQFLENFGGPYQYLKFWLGEEPSQEWIKFADELQTHFPKRNDYRYLEGCHLPRDTSPHSTFQVPLWSLGWSTHCSTKPPPYKITALQLVDEYLTNTFETGHEALNLFQGPDQGLCVHPISNEPLFFSHYVKGAARATSILMLAHVAIVHLKVEIASMHPTLYHSMLGVTCRLGMAATDPSTIALENARLSAAGSIRKKHDPITWAAKLMTLKNKGLSPTEIIRRWNDGATRDGALNGAKRTAVLAMLELSDESLNLLIKHVSEFGIENSAFQDSAFSNKKILPGHSPGCNGDKAWQKRLTITDKGFQLFIRYVHEKHARKSTHTRSKSDRTAMEEAVNMSQLLQSCFEELSEQYPIPSETWDGVLKPFLDGNNNLELDLQGAASELKNGWQPADLPCFKAVIAESTAKRDGKLERLGQGAKISPGQLEKQRFDLLMASVQHDWDSYKVWRGKCEDREAAIYFQKLQHQSARHSRAREIADAISAEERGPAWMLDLRVWDASRDSVNSQTVEECVAYIARTHQLADVKHVRPLCVLNWAAPAIYSGAVQSRQANLMGNLVNAQCNGIGAVLTPVHFYQKGQLYKVEKKCMDLLADAQLNTDMRFAISYSQKNDGRERRSLLQPAVFALPTTESGNVTYEASYNTWRQVNLMKQALVADAPMLPTAEMLVIEDMSETALPSGTEMTTHKNQSEKHQQIGKDAAYKLLLSFLTGLNETERTAILIVDLSAHTLEMAKAAYEIRSSAAIGTPVFYLGFAESEGELEWQKFHLSSWLAERFLNGNLKLPPGMTPLGDAELPSELVSALPNKPELSTLTWSQKKVDGLPTLKTPDKVLST